MNNIDLKTEHFFYAEIHLRYGNTLFLKPY